MGGNMAQRLLKDGHRLVVTNRSPGPIAEAQQHGAVGVGTIAEVAQHLSPRRAVWLMVPSGDPTEEALQALVPHLDRGDIIVDGGNSNFHDTMRRAEELAARGIDFVDAGTSGGIWGRTEGYCLMVGGKREAVAHIEPALRTLAPPDGYAHVGPSGAGHFVKMVHNGIEYGMMAAYGEGFELLHASPFDLDLAQIAGVWRYGSVVRSWLLDLAKRALDSDPNLDGIRGYVEDSGEGRWTVLEAIDRDVPLPIITLSLMQRFASRQDESFSAKLQAALRNEFGGHAVKPAGS
jgi:6-phosphogluconate dehydrogenase